MYRRTLGKGAVLWWQGDAAQSVAVVEKGSAGIRMGEDLLDVLLPGMAVGEAALLDVDGPVPRRGADVVVLEDDTQIVEYPVASVAGAEGVERLVLRTLLGQICRNHLLVGAAHPDRPLVVDSTLWQLRGLAVAAAHVDACGGGEEFRQAFRYLHGLRAGTDALRRDLAPAAGFDQGAARGLLERADLRSPELVAYLDQFLRAEAVRRGPRA